MITTQTFTGSATSTSAYPTHQLGTLPAGAIITARAQWASGRAEFRLGTTAGGFVKVETVTGPASPTITYTMPGPGSDNARIQMARLSGTVDYTVTVTIDDQVPDAPVAAFTVAPDGPLRAPVLVQFTDASTGASSHSWEFVGAEEEFSVSTAANPEHYFPSGGEHVVRLTATGPGGSATTTRTLSIAAAPTPEPVMPSSYWINEFKTDYVGAPFGVELAAPPGTNLAGWQIVKYDLNGANPITWTMPSGAVTNAAGLYWFSNPVAASGHRGWALVSPSGEVAEFFSTRAMTPTTGPAAGQAANPSNVPRESSFSSVTSVARQGTGSVNTDFTFVSLTENANQGEPNPGQAIVWPTPPTAALTFAASDLLVRFTDASTGATRVSWAFGDAASSTDRNPTHAYAAAGTYTVTLTATNDVGSTTATKTVTVTAAPVTPDPDPEPDPEPSPSWAPVTVDHLADFLGRPRGDSEFAILAGQHLGAVGEMVLAYTRGRGALRPVDPSGALHWSPALAKVVLTATARLVTNPAQVESESSDGYAVRGAFIGWSLPEQAVLSLYRRRAA